MVYLDLDLTALMIYGVVILMSKMFANMDIKSEYLKKDFVLKLKIDFVLKLKF